MARGGGDHKARGPTERLPDGRRAGLPRVTVEDAALVAHVLDWTEAGLDVADAPHLAKAAGYEAFVSFDRRVARAAAALGGVAVRER
jgi:predicted nucleic acid-binding protein